MNDNQTRLMWALFNGIRPFMTEKDVADAAEKLRSDLNTREEQVNSAILWMVAAKKEYPILMLPTWVNRIIEANHE